MYVSKNERVLAEIDRRGLTVRRYRGAFLIRGPGVELLVANLGVLGVEDLRPAAETKLTRNHQTKGTL